MPYFLLCGMVCLTSTASAADFFVAPHGDDANAGTAEQPFATLARARDAVRAAKERDPIDGRVRVHVAGGDYTVNEPLVLGPQDSGAADAPIVYKAMPGERPVFSGGRGIGGWQEAENGLHKRPVRAGVISTPPLPRAPLPR